MKLLALLCSFCMLIYESSSYSFQLTNLRSKVRNKAPVGKLSRPLFFGPDFDPSVFMYDQQLLISTKISAELSSPSLASAGFLYLAGFVTALSPCSLGMLPITLSYLGASNRKDLPYRSFFYALGMALTFTTLGLSAALAGQVFGVLQSDDSTFSIFASVVGRASKILVSSIYLLMGLNLLGLIDIQFPSLESALNNLWNPRQTSSPSTPLVASVEAVILGASASLIASPCSSPVLAALLTFVSSASSTSAGTLLLLLFSLGYATPVVTAGVLSNREQETPISVPFEVSQVNPTYEWGISILAALLVSYGTFSTLSSLRDIVGTPL